MKNLVEDAGGRLVPFPQTTPSGCVMSSNTHGLPEILRCGGQAGLTSFKTFLAEADVIIDGTFRFISDYDTAAHDFSGSFSVTANDVPALARNPAKR